MQTSAPTVCRGLTGRPGWFQHACLFPPLITLQDIVRNEWWYIICQSKKPNTWLAPLVPPSPILTSFCVTDMNGQLERFLFFFPAGAPRLKHIWNHQISIIPTIDWFRFFVAYEQLDGVCWNLRPLHPQIRGWNWTPLKEHSITSWNVPGFACGPPGVGLIGAFGTTTRAAPNYQHSCWCAAGYLSSGHA